MKKLFTILLCIFLFLIIIQVNASDPKKENPFVRVYKNDLEKIYTVFFADTVVHQFTVSVSNQKGDKLVTEELTGKGFNKPYGLSTLSNGTYTFTIQYDDKIYTESVQLRSRKQVLEQSITLEANYPDLKVNVTKYNMDPMNIFIMDTEESLLKMVYWTPNEAAMSKSIDLKQFEGYEIVVQVVQDGENKLEQLVPLY